MSTDATIAQIARDILGIETLDTRGSDRLDFYEVSVLSLREALQAAYRAGLAQRQRSRHASTAASSARSQGTAE